MGHHNIQTTFVKKIDSSISKHRILLIKACDLLHTCTSAVNRCPLILPALAASQQARQWLMQAHASLYRGDTGYGWLVG